MSRRSQQHYKALLPYGGRWTYGDPSQLPKGVAAGTYKGLNKVEAAQHVGKLFPLKGRKTLGKQARVVQMFR